MLLIVLKIWRLLILFQLADNFQRTVWVWLWLWGPFIESYMLTEATSNRLQANPSERDLFWVKFTEFNGTCYLLHLFKSIILEWQKWLKFATNQILQNIFVLIYYAENAMSAFTCIAYILIISLNAWDISV